MKQQHSTQTNGKLSSPSAFVLILLMQFAAVSNALALCSLCLHGLGCNLAPGACADSDNANAVTNHAPASCVDKGAVIASNPNNYLLYDKDTARAWLVEGSQKTPIAGPMTPDALNRWTRETGLRVKLPISAKK